MLPLKTNVASYLEERLGRVESGWADHESSMRIQVVRFVDQPEPSAQTYVTLGLSDNQLEMPDSHRTVRQELVLCANRDWPELDMALTLFGVAESLVSRKAAILRGEVVEMGRLISTKSRARALYATNPTVFGDRLLAIDSESPPLVFVWLIPITESEVNFVRKSGWRAFEAELESEDPEPWDIDRPSVSAAR